MMWGWRHGKGKLHPLLHGFRSLASRLPSQQDSFFLHISKGGNFSGFSSFSSISQNQKRQGKRNVVQVNNKFHNPFLAGGGASRRFYCVDPHNNVPPRGLIGFYRWYFENFETVPYTKRSRFIMLTIAQEKFMGEKEFEELKVAFEREGKILPPTHPHSVRVAIVLKNIIDALQRGLKKMENVSSSQYTMLHRIRMRLLRISKPKPSISHLDGLNWEVLVVNDPNIYGFCLPGGKIVVWTGLLEHFKNDAEIATIIGHEIGHIVARHAVERFTRTLWIFDLLRILNLFVTFDIKEKMSSIITRLPINRRFEMEADYIGLLLMASAGYDPQVAPKVYKELGKVDGDSMLGGYVSSHPLGRKRAKALAQAKIMEEALMIYKDVRAKA